MARRPIPCYHLPGYKLAAIGSLGILTIYNAISGIGMTALWFVGFAVLTAGIIDGAVSYFQGNLWSFPSGTIISAMIISMILAAGDYTNLFFVIIISIVLKHLIKPKGRNIFNPAALAIAVSTLFLPVYSSWWGSAGIITFIIGFLMCLLIRRIDTALSFFVSYMLLHIGKEYFIAGNYSLNLGLLSGPVAYFAFFMVIEPVTSPTTFNGRVLFGILTALLAFMFSFSPWMLGTSLFLYGALLVSNLALRVIPGRLLQ